MHGRTKCDPRQRARATRRGAEREFAFGGRTHLESRVEAYYLANTTNFGDPMRVMASPLFGRSVSLTYLMLGSGRPNTGLTQAFQSGGPRLLQAGMTLRF